MPWIWSDEIARALVRAGLSEQHEVTHLIDHPQAVSTDSSEAIAVLQDLADDEDPEQRRVA